MNNNFMGNLVVVLTAIIGVATLAVLVSRNSQTPQVIGAAGGALSNLLGTAVSPITGGGGIGGGGSGFGINLGGFGNLQF